MPAKTSAGILLYRITSGTHQVLLVHPGGPFYARKPRSGNMQEFPEVDRADWFSLKQAREKLIPAQRTFLDQLQSLLER